MVNPALAIQAALEGPGEQFSILLPDDLQRLVSQARQHVGQI
jgi:hypothetical protein